MKSIRFNKLFGALAPAVWMAVVLCSALIAGTPKAAASQSASAQVSLTPGKVIPQNFVGFSHEWQGMDWFFGTQATNVNYIYRQMIENLKNGQKYPFFLRMANTRWVGSAETDPGVAEAVVELESAIDVQFSIGVDLIHDNPDTAVQQAQLYLSKLPHSSIAAIEIGNEPDNYGVNGYRNNPYTIDNFLGDYTNWSNRILPLLPSSIRFMGPSWAGDTTLNKDMAAFEQAEGNNVSIYSHHQYGGSADQGNISPGYLLAPALATAGPAAVACCSSSSRRRTTPVCCRSPRSRTPTSRYGPLRTRMALCGSLS
jgi:hypothetical protein